MGLLDKAKALKQKESNKKQAVKSATSQKSQEKQPDIHKVYSAGAVIETDFDILYNLIQSKGKLKISEVTKMFNIDRKKAEEWVQILEEHSLVKIYYPAMGEPEVRRINLNEKDKE
jgi:hypothetical protein